MIGKRYLSNYVVTAAGVSRLSIVSVNCGLLESIKPFECETANTEYVPGVLVVSASSEQAFIEKLRVCIKNTELETAKQISRLSGLGKVGDERIVLYVIDVMQHTVSRFS